MSSNRTSYFSLATNLSHFFKQVSSSFLLIHLITFNKLEQVSVDTKAREREICSVIPVSLKTPRCAIRSDFFQSLNLFKVLLKVLEMPDGSRFDHKKSFVRDVIDLLQLVLDVLTTVVLGMPLIGKALYRLVYLKRKNIGGQLALVRLKFTMMSSEHILLVNNYRVVKKYFYLNNNEPAS